MTHLEDQRPEIDVSRSSYDLLGQSVSLAHVPPPRSFKEEKEIQNLQQPPAFLFPPVRRKKL